MQVAILKPLEVGAIAVLCTIVIHGLALGATVNFFRYENKLGRAGTGALIDFAIVALAISFACVAHLIEIALWAVLLIICREFPEFGNAFYLSLPETKNLANGLVRIGR